MALAALGFSADPVYSEVQSASYYEMDLFKIIQELHEERNRIDKVISALEDLARGKAAAAAAAAEAAAGEESGGGAAGSPPAKRKRGRPRKNSGGAGPGSTS